MTIPPVAPFIPVAAIIVTKNEEKALPRCLAALSPFAAVYVVDSGSRDRTVAFARAQGATVVPYHWNGAYPKKRQWCLDHVGRAWDWVFFIDADEEATPEILAEIAGLFAGGTPPCAGYFVRGRYVEGGKALRYGLRNNKLALFDRRVFCFPVVDDLGLPMGEIEGHYQPVFTRRAGPIGQLRHPVLHYANADRAAWLARHQRYAAWEAGMNLRQSWPADPVRWRQVLKIAFRRMKGRGMMAFIHAYILKAGILDGRAGWRQARDRYHYYRMIEKQTAALQRPRQ